MEPDEHGQGLLGIGELALVDVDRGDTAHQALLRRRCRECRESPELLRGLGEALQREVDFAGKRERPDVLRLEHAHALEGREGAFAVAAAAQDARPLPEELDDFLGIVGHFQAPRDEIEQARVVLALAHDAKQSIERGEAAHVALDGPRERKLSALLVAELVEQDVRRMLPELGATHRIVDGVAERRARLGERVALAERFRGRAQTLPTDDFPRRSLHDASERRERAFRVGRGELIVTSERARHGERLFAERVGCAGERVGAALRVRARRRELHVHERGGNVLAREGRRLFEPREPGDQTRVGRHDRARIAPDAFRKRSSRAHLGSDVAVLHGRGEPFEGGRRPRVGFGPARGAGFEGGKVGRPGARAGELELERRAAREGRGGGALVGERVEREASVVRARAGVEGSGQALREPGARGRVDATRQRHGRGFARRCRELEGEAFELHRSVVGRVGVVERTSARREVVGVCRAERPRKETSGRVARFRCPLERVHALRAQAGAPENEPRLESKRCRELRVFQPRGAREQRARGLLVLSVASLEHGERYRHDRIRVVVLGQRIESSTAAESSERASALSAATSRSARATGATCSSRASRTSVSQGLAGGSAAASVLVSAVGSTSSA